MVTLQEPMYTSPNGIVWNLFLAIIPAALGYAAGALGRRAIQPGSRWLWLLLAPMLALWLIFLPNSCYLFTEARHFLTAVERDALWTRARHEREVAMQLALAGSVAMLYSAVGALTFALSIRPVKAWIRLAGVRTAWCVPPFFLLVSLGVYLGLVVRFNSWDLLTRPGKVLETIAGVADRPLLVGTIVLFAAFLWVVYEVNDIWIDGFSLRWQRWMGRGSEGLLDRPIMDGTSSPSLSSNRSGGA